MFVHLELPRPRKEFPPPASLLARPLSMRSGSGGTGTGSSDEPEKEGREREQCGVSSKTCPAKQSVSFLVSGM